MNEVLISSVLALAGSVVGTFGGIVTTARLMTYRIEQLEKKVEKHNNLVERMYKLEEDEAVCNEKILSVCSRISELEKA